MAPDMKRTIEESGDAAAKRAVVERERLEAELSGVNDEIRALEDKKRDLEKKIDDLRCHGRISDGYETDRCSNPVYRAGFCLSCFAYMSDDTNKRVAEARSALDKAESEHRKLLGGA